MSMTFTQEAFDKLLFDSNLALSNAMHPEILPLLSKRGYNASRLQEGWTLRTKADGSYTDKLNAQLAFDNAGEEVARLKAEIKDRYYDHIGIVRVIFKDNTGCLDQLEARGTRKANIGSWIKEAKVFYVNAVETPEISEALAGYQLTSEEMEAVMVLIGKLERAVAKKESCKGANRRATKLRNEAFTALQRWMTAFRKIAMIALKGTQNPEALGWTVKRKKVGK